MGCFLGCFGGEKSPQRRKQRVNRASPQRRRNRIQNVQQESVVNAEQSIKETVTIDLVSEISELGNKPEMVEQPSPSSRKRVTFNSNVITYEHVPVDESIESLPDCAANEEQQEDFEPSSHSQSTSNDDDSLVSSVGSYPPNHRYHNARESDDEYGDSDLDDDDEDEDDYSDEDIDARFLGHEVWSESVPTSSMESKTGNSSPPATRQEVESLMVKTQLTDEFGSKTNGRDRSDYINSVLNPVENITQWEAVKSKRSSLLKPQKENFPNFGQAPSGLKAKSRANQEIAVDASLSNWLASSEVTPSKKSGVETSSSECCTSARSFEDRPILGALTVEELRQISASPSPRKSPSRNPDEMLVLGTVGTYWNNSGSGSIASFKGIPNTTSKVQNGILIIYESG